MNEQSSHLNAQKDDVYPLHTFDDAIHNHKLVSWVMRFNDVLDPKNLHGALSRLLEIGDWKKLGGRLKLKTGKLEIHVPIPFTVDRPVVSFTHDAFPAMAIEEHPIACRFPEPTNEPSIQPISTDFRSLVAPSDYPKTIEEMIRRYLPQISLHITSFRNATLVAIIWPHTMMDAIGQQVLLRSCSLVLAGREQEVPPILGARKDILKEIEDQADKGRETLALERHRLGILGSFALMARYLWDKFWNPALELRAIYLPRGVLTRLHSQVQQQLAELPKDSNDDSFVSEGDILTAWVARAIALSRPGSWPFTVVSFFNARFRLPQLRNEAAGVYAQNMVQLTFTFISSKLARGILGPIALHRRHVAQQTSSQQTLSLLRTTRKNLESGKDLHAFFGESDALPIFINNLTKADLIRSADFISAVFRQGDHTESRLNPPGTMVMYYNQPVDEKLGGPNSFYMLGQDYGDNYWLMGNLLPKTWRRIEEGLKTM